MIMLRISAIIPTYNRLPLLPTAIESIRHQTIDVHEVIVVDDGSTDGTLEWLRDLAKRMPSLRLIEQEHGGANRARNAGAALAEGELLAFLDSDDAWEPAKLAKQLESLSHCSGAVAAFTGVRQEGGRRNRTFLPRDRPSLFNLRCSNVLSTTSTALVRADALRLVGGFDETLPSCQDWDLWFRLRQQGELVVVREPLVRVNTSADNRISVNAEKVFFGHSIIFKRLQAEVCDPAQRRVIEANHCSVLAENHMRLGRPLMAMRLALKGLLTSPNRWAVRLAITSGWRALGEGIGRLAPRLRTH